MNLKSKPYYPILPPLFGNLKKQLQTKKSRDVIVQDIDIKRREKFYKPICTIVDFANEEFEVIR
ncbi:MAG: hypothetical protein CVU09_10715 [Bacteroidetes bacterium HGW-Bacteroidetes-4]|jgi:hypothetical protein|nr:MAG: hypothetical protein CVU09_10715 [Bacteroidetes bacterium HGW-Bacteroidetes-4]